MHVCVCVKMGIYMYVDVFICVRMQCPMGEDSARLALLGPGTSQLRCERALGQPVNSLSLSLCVCVRACVILSVCRVYASIMSCITVADPGMATTMSCSKRSAVH
jgi:hypothetical protein